MHTQFKSKDSTSVMLQLDCTYKKKKRIYISRFQYSNSRICPHAVTIRTPCSVLECPGNMYARGHALRLPPDCISIPKTPVGRKEQPRHG